MKSSNSGLIPAILFAAVVIAGALVYFGSQMSGSSNSANLTDKIEKGIEDYIQTQNDKQKKSGNSREIKVGDAVKVSSDDHIFGNPDAEISLIEYSDFECPFCKRFHPTGKEIVEKFDGKVNWVYRHFPLGFHDPLATQEALASECAAELGGNDTFWAYADKIYERTTSNGRGLKTLELTEIAVELELDEDDFQKCLDDEKFIDRIKRDIAEGRAAGVTGTPGNILINNKTGDAKLVPGAQPFSAFETAINELLGE